MKKKWFRAMELADEKYLAQADPEKGSKTGVNKRVRRSLLASCACFALVLCSFWLFLPLDNTPPSTQEHAQNEYYPVIQQLSLLQWEKPKYKNNFEMVMDAMPRSFLATKGDAMSENYAPGEADGAALGSTPTKGTLGYAATQGGTYEEITDNQVDGITEADRIKRSSTHIYYLDGNTLRFFSIAGQDSQELGKIELIKAHIGHLRKWEFYLSEDCRNATVICLYSDAQAQLQVQVVSIDVSDPVNPTEKNRIEVTGNYLSSRMVDDKLLLMTEFVFNKKDIDFEEETTFLPQINGESIGASDIILPETVNNCRYTVVMHMDANTLAVQGQAAFLSYTKHVYVSQEHIYLANTYVDVQENKDGVAVRNTMTEITCLAYKDGFEKKGSVMVRGYIKDQWSMDEYEGILRVVTTTNTVVMEDNDDSSKTAAERWLALMGNPNASLYCVDLQNFALVAKVEDFAPPGEDVRSVRFDKTTAYVCTSIEMSDPVFFFDLSDLSNITYKDTGTIDGFSTSLIDFGDGYLLGIGREDIGTFKVEIYREGENGVESFCKFTQPYSNYSGEYKSYYVDRENRLLGLGISSYGDTPRSGYLVLHFDGYQLHDVLHVDLNGEVEMMRGVYIDGFMYMFGAEDFKVEKV